MARFFIAVFTLVGTLSSGHDKSDAVANQSIEEFFIDNCIKSFSVDTSILDISEFPADYSKTAPYKQKSIDLTREKALPKFWMEQVQRIGREIRAIGKVVPELLEACKNKPLIDLTIRPGPIGRETINFLSLQGLQDPYILSHELFHYAMHAFERAFTKGINEKIYRNELPPGNSNSLAFSDLSFAESLPDTYAIVANGDIRGLEKIRPVRKGVLFSPENLSPYKIAERSIRAEFEKEPEVLKERLSSIRKRYQTYLDTFGDEPDNHAMGEVIQSFLLDFADRTDQDALEMHRKWLNITLEVGRDPKSYVVGKYEIKKGVQASSSAYFPIDAVLDKFEGALQGYQKEEFASLRNRYQLLSEVTRPQELANQFRLAKPVSLEPFFSSPK